MICHTKRLLSEPLFSVGTGVQEFNRYLSTVNRVFCLMQWCDRELTAFGMSHRTAPPELLFSVETGAQPLSVNRQPCLCVSLDFSQQLIQNCIRAWSFLNDLVVQHQFLKTLCVFKRFKCFNRYCRHPSFDNRDMRSCRYIVLVPLWWVIPSASPRHLFWKICIFFICDPIKAPVISAPYSRTGRIKHF